MAEFQHATELFMWLQILAATACIAIIAGTSAVLLVPGFLSRANPYSKGLIIGTAASALTILAGFLPFYAVGAEGKIASACAAVMSDFANGRLDAMSQSNELMVKSFCGEGVYGSAL